MINPSNVAYSYSDSTMPFLKSPGLNRLARALALLLAVAVVLAVLSYVHRKKEPRHFGSSKSLGPP